MKKVQIDYELFRKLIFYHLCSDAQYEEEIRNGLEEKLDALVRHRVVAVLGKNKVKEAIEVAKHLEQANAKQNIKKKRIDRDGR